ncbi:MAG: hypothetical protein JKY52_18790 [Flavobacteriales bacterium]|nr:hypothetical protein [Flavobacteriales bacterium]
MEFYLKGAPTLTEINKWEEFLFPFLKLFAHDRDLCFIDMYSSRDTLIKEFGKPEKRKCNGSKYQVVWVKNLEDEQLQALLTESQFYLGYIVVAPIEENDYK